MKTRTILITTLLSSGLMLNSAPSFAEDSITTGARKTATSPISDAAMDDPHVAAAGFVEHINFARVSLAMKKTSQAKQHLAQANGLIRAIKNAPMEHRRVQGVESGRILYQYDTEYKDYYFPIQTGPVQVKQMSSGPFWAQNDLAVTDASIVYLSLDLTDGRAETFLDDARTAIDANDLKKADTALARLTNAVVSVESRSPVPHDKARDNLSLARQFIEGKNYDGARYALGHADEALNEMQNNDIYASQRTAIIAMRKDMIDLQDKITRKDPTVLEKADRQIQKWWDDMKTWSKAN